MNRRNWLQQVGTLTAGLGAAQFKTFAWPATGPLAPAPSGNSPARLSANESPYGPSPLARQAMADSITNTNRYNWGTTGNLISAIAKKNDLPEDSILIGAGSTEILDLLVQSLASQKGNFITSHPSYSNWSGNAERAGLKKIAVPLTKDKQHDLPSMLAGIDAGTKMVYVCNPNNPTGTICDRNALISFINEATRKTTVIIDEAYLDFTDRPSVSPLVLNKKNLIIVKTFSKIYGLAGARVGYALAHKDTIEQISKLQSWANGGVSVISREGAIATLKDDSFLRQCYIKNEEARKFTVDQLAQLSIACIPSHTNFIYFSLADYNKDFFALLKSNNIEGTHIYEEDGKWTRITIGTMSEMQKFIAAIK